MKRHLQRRLRRFFNRNYAMAKAWRYLDYWWQHRHIDNPIVVYQMGKVGSSSVVAALEARNFDVFQVHVLTHDWIERVEGQYRKASLDHGRGIIDEHLLASMFLRRKLDKDGTIDGKKPTVVTLIRDPIARNVSSFFQAFRIYFSDVAARLEREDLSYDDQVALLLDLFINRFEEHDTPLKWFDVHFKPVFGIDVYAEPFPVDKGYAIYRNEQADALLIRLEDLRRVASEAFESFIGLPRLELKDTNVAAEKGYSSAYEKFQDELRLPAAYVDRMYSSQMVQHFYSPAEIERFRRRWVLAPSPQPSPASGRGS